LPKLISLNNKQIDSIACCLTTDNSFSTTFTGTLTITFDPSSNVTSTSIENAAQQKINEINNSVTLTLEQKEAAIAEVNKLTILFLQLLQEH
jgi:hypothetical protein